MTNFYDKKKNTLPLYILLLTSTDTFMFGTNINNIYLYIPRIVGAVFLIYVILKNRGKLCFDKKYFFVLMIMLSIIITSSLLNETAFGTLSSRLISVVVGFFIVAYYNYMDFAKIFDKFMYLIAIFSIITSFIANIFPSLLSIFPTVVNTANYHFIYFLIGGSGISRIGGDVFIRSTSIFWEPGAFAIYLIFALYIQLFSLEKRYIRRIVIYVISLVLTLSTTGYISLITLLMAYLTSQRQDSNLSNRVKLLSIGLLLIFGALILFGENTMLYNNVFEKIIDRQSTSVTRYASIVNGLQIAWDHPFFGISPNNMREYMTYYAQNKSTLFNFGANPMNTNTVTYQFAAYGLIFGFLFTFGTYKFSKQYKDSLLTTILVFLTILLAYSGQAFYSFLPFTIMFYGYNNRLNLKRGL